LTKPKDASTYADLKKRERATKMFHKSPGDENTSVDIDSEVLDQTRLQLHNEYFQVTSESSSRRRE
jgi:hypothetical protein